MRILLDENMPRKLLAALVAEGHEVDSVESLQISGPKLGRVTTERSMNLLRPITIFASRAMQSFRDEFATHNQTRV